jgi:hypothetical protein
LIFLSFGSFKEKINSNKNASRPCTQGSWNTKIESLVHIGENASKNLRRL